MAQPFGPRTCPNDRLMRMIRGWFRIVLSLSAIAVWTVFTVLGARRRKGAERLQYQAQRQRGGARILSRIGRFRVTVAGETPPPGPMLYVANHITALDPILIGTQVDVAFAGKIEIIGWPVMGWIAREHGIIGVERSRRSSTRVFVEAIRNRLAEGVPVMVFPEGGIGWGDVLLPFKTGAFEAISGMGRIQTVFMDVAAIDGVPTPGSEGRHRLSHKHHDTLFGHLAHAFSYRSVDIQVRFGPSFSADEMKRKALADMTRAAMLRLQDQKQ